MGDDVPGKTTPNITEGNYCNQRNYRTVICFYIYLFIFCYFIIIVVVSIIIIAVVIVIIVTIIIINIIIILVIVIIIIIIIIIPLLNVIEYKPSLNISLPPDPPTPIPDSVVVGA